MCAYKVNFQVEKGTEKLYIINATKETQALCFSYYTLNFAEIPTGYNYICVCNPQMKEITKTINDWNADKGIWVSLSCTNNPLVTLQKVYQEKDKLILFNHQTEIEELKKYLTVGNTPIYLDEIRKNVKFTETDRQNSRQLGLELTIGERKHDNFYVEHHINTCSHP